MISFARCGQVVAALKRVLDNLETGKDPMEEARRRGAKRTALIVAVIAIAIFLLSILQMVKFK